MSTIIKQWDALPNWLQSLILAAVVAGCDYLLQGNGVTWQGLLLAILAGAGNWWNTERAKIVKPAVVEKPQPGSTPHDTNF